MEKLSLGLSLTVVGMGIVVFVLFLLQLFMNVEAKLFTTRSTKSNEETGSRPEPPPQPPVTTTQPPELAPQPPVTVSAAQEENPVKGLSPQVVAAIMGVIACYTGAPARNFRLISVRKAEDRQAAAAWTLQGHTDLINTRSSFYTKGGTR